MTPFQMALGELIAPMDEVRHADEIAILRRCRSEKDLAGVASGDGWLTREGVKKRLKLVKHGSGTYLVVQYEDGWSTRVSMVPVPGGRQ